MSQLLTLYKIAPAHPPSSNVNSPTAIPIVSHYTEHPSGGYQVHLTLDNSHEGEEIGLVVNHGTQVFAQIRSQYESHIAPEILWGAALHEDDDDDEGEEEEEEEQDENVSGMVGGRAGSEDAQRTVRRAKQQPELLHLSTNIATAHSGILITPTSATTLTPNLAVVNFTEFSSASYPPSTGAYRELVPVSASQSHIHSFSQSQVHHLPREAPNTAAPPFLLEATGYSRVPAQLNIAPLSNYSVTRAISSPIPLAPQIPADGAKSGLRHTQRHMHQNMDL